MVKIKIKGFSMFDLLRYKLGLKFENQERRESFINRFGEYYYQSGTSDKDIEEFTIKRYIYFSKFIQSIFISKDGYIIDTGNYETVNYELMMEVEEKIRKHPIIWKLFFMIA